MLQVYMGLRLFPTHGDDEGHYSALLRPTGHDHTITHSIITGKMKGQYACGICYNEILELQLCAHLEAKTR